MCSGDVVFVAVLTGVALRALRARMAQLSERFVTGQLTLKSCRYPSSDAAKNVSYTCIVTTGLFKGCTFCCWKRNAIQELGGTAAGGSNTRMVLSNEQVTTRCFATVSSGPPMKQMPRTAPRWPCSSAITFPVPACSTCRRHAALWRRNGPVQAQKCSRRPPASAAMTCPPCVCHATAGKKTVPVQ